MKIALLLTGQSGTGKIALSKEFLGIARPNPHPFASQIKRHPKSKYSRWPETTTPR